MRELSILKFLDRVAIVKETATEYHCNCPRCGSGGFKIEKSTGKYYTFKCGCMDTVAGKKEVVKAIFPPLTPTTPTYQKYPRGKQKRKFYYRDKLGNPSLTVERIDKGDGSKKDVFREPAGIPDATIRPYLSERLEVKATERVVSLFICEGEPKSEQLNALFPEFVATNGVGGKWRSDHTDYVVGLGYSDVILCPDKDKPGLENMVKVARQFLKHGISCHWVLPEVESWRSLPEKDGSDIVDWVEDGVSSHDVLTMLVHSATLPAWLQELITPPPPPSKWEAPDIYDWLTMSEQDGDFWLIDTFLSLGSNMLVGKSGVGKSILGTQMAIAVATGKDFLGRKVKQGKVIYHASDEPQMVLKNRLNMNELGKSPHAKNFIPLIRDIEGNQWGIQHLDALEDLFIKHKPVLFVIDSLRSAIAQPIGVNETDEEIGHWIVQLKGMCERHGVALLIIHHPRKNGDGEALDSVCGHNSITSPLDCIWLVKKDASTMARGNDARKMTLIKSRIGEMMQEVNLMLDPHSLSFNAPIPHNSPPGNDPPASKADQPADLPPETIPLIDRAKEVFRQIGKPLTVKECAVYLKAHTESLDTVRRYCERLVKAGFLEVIPATMPKQYKYTGVNKEN